MLAGRLRKRSERLNHANVVTMCAVLFFLAGCTGSDARRDAEISEKSAANLGATTASDMAERSADMGMDMDAGEELSCIDPAEIRQSALLDLSVPGELEDAIEVLSGGPDLDADEIPDTVVQVFLEEQRKIGIYLSNQGCMRFAGGFIASSTEILETSNQGVRDLNAWLPAECANDLGGVLTRHRFDGESYRVDLTIDCPCDAEALRDPECPQP